MSTKITRLTLENFKRIRAVNISPSGSVIKIAGMNGNGKSSVLDGIDVLIRGGKAAPAEPVRRGEKKAVLEGQLDNGLTIRRTFSADGGGTLIVQSQDGARFPSPQAILDKLYGQFAFDPLDFMRAKPSQRVETLRAVVGLDFTALDQERAKLFAERTDMNRRVGDAAATVKQISFHQDAPSAEISAVTLMEELTAAQAINRKEGEARKAMDEAIQSANQAHATMKDLERRLAEAQEFYAAKKKAEGDAIQNWNKAKANKADEAPIKTRIASVDADNAKVRDNRRYADAKKTHASLTEKAEAFTRRITEIDEEKASMLATTAFPIPGLGFGDSDVTLNGIAFEQGSKAEQLRTSAAIGIATHPGLPIMLIRDGSLLDKNSLALLSEYADSVDAQIFLEVVGDGGSTGIVIEDGCVAGQEATVAASDRRTSAE